VAKADETPELIQLFVTLSKGLEGTSRDVTVHETAAVDGQPSAAPRVFIQWKGTNACLDFTCTCGTATHFDGLFCYALVCPGCKKTWRMPQTFAPVEQGLDEAYVGAEAVPATHPQEGVVCDDTPSPTDEVAALRATLEAIATMDMDDVARSWLAHQGYDPATIESLLRTAHDPRCELQGYDWVCSDGETSYHPDRDKLDEDAAAMMFVFETVLAVLAKTNQ
jgi:hypothetical protein